MALTALCLTPLLVAAYYRTLSYAPMKGLEGSWSSDVWQSDIPKAIRTRLHGDAIAFYSSNEPGDQCGSEIGDTPALSDGPSSVKQGWILLQRWKTKMTAWRDGGLLAVSYDQNDPWVFFTRGSAPRRTVTVRYHQTDDKLCVD